MSSFTNCEKEGIAEELFSPDISDLLKQERSKHKKYQTRKEIFEKIFAGGMPDICTGNAERDIYFRSYVHTYNGYGIMCFSLQMA